MGVHHAVLKGLGDGLSAEHFAEGVGIRECCGRTFSSHYIAIDSDELTGVCRAIEIILEAGIAGATLAFADAQRTEYHRAGTDGRDKFAGVVLLLYGLAHKRVVAEILRSRESAGNHQKVGIAEVGDVFDESIGCDTYIMCCGYLEVSCRGYDTYVHVGPAEHIYGNQSFDFLCSIGNEFINFCHGFCYFKVLVSCGIKQYGDRLAVSCFRILWREDSFHGSSLLQKYSFSLILQKK